MKVIVEISSWYKKYTGGTMRFELEVTEGTKAVAAVLAIGIPEAEIGFMTLKNEKEKSESRLTEDEYILQPNDHLKVYPLIIGG